MAQISVIIPVYNRANLIGNTLWSLLNQTLPADEVIVVDDGSTDGTTEVTRAAFAKWVSRGLEKGKLPELKILFQENKGPAAARNAGFKASTGKFIHFFDSDDLAALNKHEVQFSTLQKSGADIAIGPWVQGRFTGNQFQAENHVFQQRGLPEGDLIKALLTNWSIVPHSCLFRRSIVEMSGGFPEDLFLGEDQFMFLSCLLAGARVVHTPDTIEFYRLGDVSKITENEKWSTRRIWEWTHFLLKAREICLQHCIDPMEWFGFRRRVWETQQDLCRCDSVDENLQNKLGEFVQPGIGAELYRWHRRIERWGGGLQQRMTGGRAHDSFRMSPVTQKQIRFLNQLEYSYDAPRSILWFSCVLRSYDIL